MNSGLVSLDVVTTPERNNVYRLRCLYSVELPPSYNYNYKYKYKYKFKHKYKYKYKYKYKLAVR